MKKYLISIADDIDERITKIVREKGITNNNEIRDTVIFYYTQATSKVSYAQIILDLENELSKKKESLSKGEKIEFRLGELDAMKAIEKISPTMKPSTIKAVIGKQFYAKVQNGEDTLYKSIEYKCAKQRVVVYILKS